MTDTPALPGDLADDIECGCCEINDYDGDPYSDEPWCAACGHSPEEHQPS